MTQNVNQLIKEDNASEGNSLFYEQLPKMIELCSTEDLDGAIEKLTEFSEKFPEFSTGYTLIGIINSKLGFLEKAIKNFRQALLLLPTEETAQTLLSAIYNELSHPKEVLKILEQSLVIHPENPDYCQLYCHHVKLICSHDDDHLNLVCSENYSDKTARRFLKVLSKDNVIRPNYLRNPIMALLKTNVDFMKVLKITTSIDFNNNLENIIGILSKVPLFWKIIELCSISDLTFECLLHRLRTAFLLNVDVEEKNSLYLKLQCSLALHCFTNEYVYGEDEEETQSINELENYIVEALDGGMNFPTRHIACLASFRPLSNYSWAKNLDIPSEMAELFLRQVYEPESELSIRASIPSITAIKDGTSIAVRDQYEESPYPRWTNVGLVDKSMTIEEIAVAAGLRVSQNEKISSEPTRILIAGCGTGQHSLEAATRYNNSCVTAIDLSLSSLSFAIRRTKELSVSNVNYVHGDILNVKLLEKQFDVIEAMGVLHHMKDPTLGWGVLKSALRPRGLMRIGLYSRLARRHLQIIKEKMGNPCFPMTHRNICEYRKEILISNDSDIRRATRYSDFYSTSELRDLLFHVQEQNFTLIEIKDVLIELNLNFCGFESVDYKTKAIISHGNQNFDRLYSLDAWHQFELSNPDYFSGMYSFWVQRID